MGFLDTVKGWFNIGGVKVTLQDVDPVIHVGMNEIQGKAVLVSKSDKEVLSVNAAVIHEHKFKKDGEEKTESHTLGEEKLSDGFMIKAGETREFEFRCVYHIKESMQHMGGVAGAVGKLGGFAMGKSDTYSLVVSCDVKGTVLDPSASETLKIRKRD